MTPGRGSPNQALIYVKPSRHRPGVYSSPSRPDLGFYRRLGVSRSGLNHRNERMGWLEILFYMTIAVAAVSIVAAAWALVTGRTHRVK